MVEVNNIRRILFLISILLFFTLTSVSIQKTDGSKSSKIIYEFYQGINKIENQEPNGEKLQYGIMVKFKYELPKYPKNSLEDLVNKEDIRTYKSELHNSLKDYFDKRNKEIIDYLDLNELLCVSQYSPFADRFFDDVDEFKNVKAILDNVIDSNYIEWVCYFSGIPFNYEEASFAEDLGEQYLIEDLLNDIGINYPQTYSGNEINIGILDEGTPDNTTYVSDNIVNDTGIISSSHTTLVATIAASTIGVARNANIHIAPANTLNSLSGAINQMIAWEVDIINISSGWYTDGNYTSIDSYFDFIINENKIPITKSVGNNSNGYGFGDSIIASPGVGLNVLSIGASTKAGQLAKFSSTEIDEDYEDIIFTPKLLAPGSNIKAGSLNAGSGTSFAAPVVAGVIALLFEEFPSLMLKPELIMAALMDDADYAIDQISFFDSKAGAGIINYQKARTILSNVQYQDYTVTSLNNNNDVVATKTITLAANKMISITQMTLYNSTSQSPTVNNQIAVLFPSFSNFKIEIRNSNGGLELSSQKSYNINHLEYTNNTQSEKTITINIVLNSVKIGNESEIGSFVYSIKPAHVHSYTHHITKHNYIYHKLYCICGAFVYAAHDWIFIPFDDGINHGQVQYCPECGDYGLKVLEDK